ncbi:MAG: radical SAM protein [Clostridiales bacterium]|jgi:MoaA/NifB/PqqE/SkfB family radical SAM enzyme|nr:radical SAM protein [Clostridiales bacterium]
MTGLNGFLNNGIFHIGDTAGRFYLGNRKGQSFALRLAMSLRKSAKVRAKHEKLGVHIPPFLIASIAASCNLRCSGCYARANGGCGDGQADKQLGVDDWRRIFQQASDAGVSFILLAGGEPLTRREIIELATRFPAIVFPVFTNGTLIDEAYVSLFDKHRHIIPVLSIEGDAAQTDARRGAGISDRIARTAGRFKERGILFGTSITVTSKNYRDVTHSDFAARLYENGCGLAFYVEYVPVEEHTEHLTLSGAELCALSERIEQLRTDNKGRGMSIMSFPGDEDRMGGCLAAGRGFFHINAVGAAEPCPFSPYSEINLREQSLMSVLQSEFFKKVRTISAADAINRKGGCTLFRLKDEVSQTLQAAPDFASAAIKEKTKE